MEAKRRKKAEVEKRKKWDTNCGVHDPLLKE
jgi:hypothetical protein